MRLEREQIMLQIEQERLERKKVRAKGFGGLSVRQEQEANSVLLLLLGRVILEFSN